MSAKFALLPPDVGRCLSGPRHSAEPEPVSRLRPSGECRYRNGHRGYLDNVTLISTRAHKVPVAKGHRAFIGKQEWR